MTDRLYYDDCYLTEFRARVLDASPDRTRIYLDRTVFYPPSGGQPYDLGSLNGVRVTEVGDEEERIVHVLDSPLPDAEVEGRIDWTRRFDHMQQHTGQHLLSAVLVELFGAQTVSFHLGVESSTIDIARASLEPAELRRVEERCNEVVFEDRLVTISYQDSTEDLGLRKPTERQGRIRIISIADLDRSACGGTHVRRTGEIGPILIRKLDKIRGNVRIEFLCGMRAVKRARADYEAVSAIARSFSAPLDETPALVSGQFEKLQETERALRKLSVEFAQVRGRQLYATTGPEEDGLRRIRRRVQALTEELRAEAQAFVEGEKALFIATVDDPPSVLVAASRDSGVNAGQKVKEAVTRVGGRGGGSATMAQGSVPSRDLLDSLF
ncbi:MAG TPA: alanyl-tRNA editing protein [Bryobacteraceae bacterium]|nr:alanyl-tRNA editing protein [Bryobacteraceae bacterium]